jgi:nucleotide-binding universal stress UspA family protein
VPHRDGRRPLFQPIHTVLVPIIYGDESLDALHAALYLAQHVILVGLVRVPEGESISAASSAARDLRQRLSELSVTIDPAVVGSDLTIHSQVYVSATPWQDLCQAARELNPDLLLLDWDSNLYALGMAAADVLHDVPCNVALLRGVLPQTIGRVLLPIRGGPHADLAVRIGLSFSDAAYTVLHLRRPNAPTVGDAPFRGLQQILPQLQGVETLYVMTDDPAERILEQSRSYDLVIMGATALPLTDATSLGSVADRVLRESMSPVLVVKTRRPMVIEPSLPAAANGDEVVPEAVQAAELAGQEAISILVDKWFAENTFHADEFADLDRLVQRKHDQGLTISLALPALNEEETVGNVIRTVKQALMEEYPLLDEMVLIDSNSTDRTREIAADLGVPVYIHQRLLPSLGARRGKGEALWKSLLVTRGDIVAWIDTDIANIHPRFVYGILGPLIQNPTVQYVKGFYQRPLTIGSSTTHAGGGRVTELMARPLLNFFYPELSGVIQPLSGEYAGRRTALEAVPFYSGYGVETGLLIEIFERHGLASLAQVDLLERVHHNQPLEALSKMSFAILQVVMQKLERRFGMNVLSDVNKTMKLIRSNAYGYWLDVEEIVERERPPMITVPDYDRMHANGSPAEAVY